MALLKNKKGFNLVEVLIALSLFAIVAVTATSILITVNNISRTTSIQMALYDDMRSTLQLITNEIQNGTIDFDEYYNACVIQEGCDAGGEVYYGVNHGVYGSRFYDPGKALDGGTTFNPTNLGLECSYPPGFNPVFDICEVEYTLSTDLNTGRNPFTGNSNLSNAFCDGTRGLNAGNCALMNYAEVEQLFLLDKTGTKKTILGKKLINSDGDFGLGMVVLEGFDQDQNGFMETFTCSEEYVCDEYPEVYKLMPGISYAGLKVPKKSDLGVTFMDNISTSQFVPLTPLRSSIVDLKFQITPVEDPYKAYAETAIQDHPAVTIILTMDLASAMKENYPGDFDPVTIQSTVTAGIVGSIDSYPPVNDTINPASGDSWIFTLFDQAGMADQIVGGP